MLKIDNLHVKLEEEDKVILKGVNLEVRAGEVHAIMGPNGSGKSTLSYVLSGRDGYEVTEGRATLEGSDLLGLEPEERAALGLFLAFQYPVEIPGVGNLTFMRTALNAQRKARGEAELNAAEFLRLVREKASQLQIDAEMLKRPVNVGFSGGEKKRNEILQMAILEPRMCILDETDSGVRRRCHEAGGRRGERPALAGPGVPRHHPLPAAARPHHAGRGAHHGRRADRADRRAGTRARGRAERLRGHREVGGVMAVPALKIDGAGALLAGRPEPQGEAGWARTARAKAARRLAERGAPVRRDEYWKFTDPAGLTVQPAHPAALLAAEDEASGFGATRALRLVFVDGVFSPDRSDAPKLEGVEIEPLAEVLATDIHWAREVFGVLEDRGQTPVDRPLASLNTARATDGVAIRVTGRPVRPIQLVYLREAEGAEAMVHHVVKLDAGADLTLLEGGPAAARLNSVLEVEVAEGAAFHHVRTQGRDHERRAATALFARLGRKSRLKSFTLTVNGRLTRNESIVEFTGDDASAHIAGACVGDGDFRHDDTVFVTHDAVNCESRQVFKKVLRGGAVGVFQGKILVRPGAQKTDGYQISQGLLLDEASQFLAKPELEIYADDVACSHGSTSGAVDEEAAFYLTSRGIPRRTAEELLVLAFLDEAISEIEDPELADELRARLAAWLARRRK